MTDMSMKSPFAFRSEIHHVDEIVDRSELADNHSVRERYVVVRPVMSRSIIGQISNITEQSSVHESQHISYRYSRAVVGDIPPFTFKKEITNSKPKYNQRQNTDQSYIEQYRKKKEIERTLIDEEPVIIQRLVRPKPKPVQQRNDIESTSNKCNQPAPQYTQQNVPQTPKSSSSQMSESGHSLNDSPQSKFSDLHQSYKEINTDEEDEEEDQQDIPINSINFNDIENGSQEDEILEEEESFYEKQNNQQNEQGNNFHEEEDGDILKSESDTENDEDENVNKFIDQNNNKNPREQSYQPEYINYTQTTKSYLNTSRVVIHQKERSTTILEPEDSVLEESKSQLNTTTTTSKLRPFQRPPMRSNTSKLSATNEIRNSKSTMETPTRPIRYSQDMIGKTVKPQHVSFVQNLNNERSENEISETKELTNQRENVTPVLENDTMIPDNEDDNIQKYIEFDNDNENRKKKTPKRKNRRIPVKSKRPKLTATATQIDLESDKETIIFDPDEPMSNEPEITREEFIEFKNDSAGPMTPSELEDSIQEEPKRRTPAKKKQRSAAQTMRAPVRKMSPEQFSNAHRFEPGYLASIANGECSSASIAEESETPQPTRKNQTLVMKAPLVKIIREERPPAIVKDNDIIVFGNPRAGLDGTFKKRKSVTETKKVTEVQKYEKEITINEEWRQTATEVKLNRTVQDQSPIKIAPAHADTSLAEFLETEARMAESPEKSAGLGFIPLDDRPPKTRKFRPPAPPPPRRQKRVEPNYPKILNIVRARVDPGPEFRAANAACAASKSEHLAVLVSFPLLALEGIYRLDRDEALLLKVWGDGPEEIGEGDVTRFFHYNMASRDFDEVPYSKFDQNIEVVSID